jgi:hypothetical protein
MSILKKNPLDIVVYRDVAKEYYRKDTYDDSVQEFLTNNCQGRVTFLQIDSVTFLTTEER